MTAEPSPEEREFVGHLDRLMDDAARRGWWPRFDLLMRVAAAARQPYLVQLFVDGLLDWGETDDGSQSLWLLWSWLGDRYELGDQSAAVQAESLMRAMAQDWLVLPEDLDSRRAYIERWDKTLMDLDISIGLGEARTRVAALRQRITHADDS